MRNMYVNLNKYQIAALYIYLIFVTIRSWLGLNYIIKCGILAYRDIQDIQSNQFLSVF